MPQDNVLMSFPALVNDNYSSPRRQLEFTTDDNYLFGKG